MTDSHTGDADAGRRIKELRAELSAERTVAYFTTPDQLASAAAPAIYWIRDGAALARQPDLPPNSSERRRPTGSAKPRPKYEHLWSPGSVLRVRFVEDDPTFERAIRRFLPLWSAYANIKFEFSEDNDAEVRIAFKQDGSNWAYAGTDSMRVSLNQPTMNFAFLDTPEINVLHEFGHVLGLLHEHNHPKGIKWNKQLVYKAMSRPPNNWDKAGVDTNMFGKWPASRYPIKKAFDPVSVMAYPLPKEWTDLDADFGYKDSLSAGDKDFIGRLYPFE